MIAHDTSSNNWNLAISINSDSNGMSLSSILMLVSTNI